MIGKCLVRTDPLAKEKSTKMMQQQREREKKKLEGRGATIRNNVPSFRACLSLALSLPPFIGAFLFRFDSSMRETFFASRVVQF